MSIVIGTRHVKGIEKPIEILYADLLTLSQNSQLIVNAKYKITDYRSRERIYPTMLYYGDVSQGDLGDNSLEPLIVTAVSTSELDVVAISEVFPDDIIYYELIDSYGVGGDRGRIYFRHDTVKNNKVWGDYRTLKFRTWETAVGSGIFVEFVDPGNNEEYVDTLMFPIGSTDVSVGKNWNNIVLSVGGQNVWNVTIGESCESIRFKQLFNSIISTYCGSIRSYNYVNECIFDLCDYGYTFKDIVKNSIFSAGTTGGIIFEGTLDYIKWAARITGSHTISGNHNNESIGIQDSGFWSCTYAELLAWQVANKLIPTQKYKINNYRTRHLIPNTVNYNEGPIEPLIVTAVTTSTLSAIVQSEMYPQDIIYYELEEHNFYTLEDPTFSGSGLDDLYNTSELVNSNNDLSIVIKVDGVGSPNTFKWSEDGGDTWRAQNISIIDGYTDILLDYEIYIGFNSATGHTLNDQWSFNATNHYNKGRITERKDVIKNIHLFEDWRSIKYRRWETSPASGIYTVLISNDGTYVDRYIFENDVDPEFSSNIYIEKQSDNALINSIFTSSSKSFRVYGRYLDNTIISADKVTIQGDFIQNIIGYNFNTNIIEGGFFGNIIGNNFANNYCRYYFNNNTIGNNFNSNFTESQFNQNNIGNDFHYNVLGHYFYNNTIGYQFASNFISSSFTSNTVSDEFQYNFISMDITAFDFGNADSQLSHILSNTESTFSYTDDITASDVVDVTNSSVIGVFNLSSTNATENISSLSNITNMVSSRSIELCLIVGLTITFIGTAFASVNADGQILLGAVSRVLNGSKRDSIKLKKESITNGNGTFTVAREVSNSAENIPVISGNQYYSPMIDSTADSTSTIDFDNGNVQYLQLISDTTSSLEFLNGKGGSRYVIILKQPSSGAEGTVSWPVNVKWSGGTEPTLTVTNDKADIIDLIYDQISDCYYAGANLNF